MRIIAGCFLTVLFAYSSTFAQTTFSAIQGKVFTDNAGAAEGLPVVLLRSPDSSVVKSTISSKTGVFYFDHLNAGKYILFITKLNYNKSYSGPYEVAPGKNRDIGFILLKPAGKMLKEVSITGKKDFAEVRSDRTVLNVDQNIMAAGASLYDVLNTSPGVKVVNDDILYRGGQKTMIAIDGKPVLFTGEELVNFLKNFQSSSISQVELIENPGAKYGASAGGGMINIILKKKKAPGSNFTVTGSAAYGQKYKSGTGLNYNLRTGKLNLYSSYGFQDNKIDKSIYNDRNVLDSGQLYNFKLNYVATLKNVNNNFSIGGDYQLTKGQNIGFLVNGFYNNITINKFNSTVESTNGQRDSTINTQSVIDRNINNLSYNLNYRANLDQSGNSVLSANGDYSNYNRHSSEVLQNNFLNAAGQTDNNPIFYHVNSPSHITIKSANIDFKQALSKSVSFEAGIKSSGVNSDNQIIFQQKVKGGYIPVTNFTDHFIYHERIDAAYLQFDGKFGKTGLTVGLRDEKTASSSSSFNPGGQVIPDYKGYNNIFPKVQLSQDMDKNNQLTAFYSRDIQRPNYQDLNPFIGYVDHFYYSTGNPYLKPEYINTFDVSDFVMKKYKVGLSVVITDDYYNTIFEQVDSTKKYTNIKANLGTRYQYLLHFNIPVDITNWWNINADLVGYHEKYSYYGDRVASKTTDNFSAILNQNFKLTSKLSAQLYNLYYSSSYYIISQYQAQYYMNAALSYSVLGNKGTIKLAVIDIFNTFYNKYQTNYANLNIASKDKLGSRFISATFTYHFGTSAARSRNNTTDEQKRLGGSSNEN
ncbi:MAG: TonB-dependent receptor [Mucilaginibacter sp.]|nr:TonB-dependent receptor [Mucilaginibacter sp.]